MRPISFSSNLLLQLLLALPALAHGGVYIGPGSTTGPGGATGGGPSTTSAGAPVTDSAAWDVWWSLNRDRFLDLRAAIREGEPVTGSDDFFLGPTHAGTEARTALRPDEKTLRESVVPALRAALDGAKDVDLVTGILLALAKIGERGVGSADELVALFRGYLADSNQEIHETAAIALGVLADPSAAPLLADLLGDEREGRGTVGAKSVAVRTRAFAAYGLGLIGARAEGEAIRRYAIHHLVHALEDDDLSEEIAVACVVALGLLPLEDIPVTGTEPPAPSHSRRGEIVFLLARFDARDTHDTERAQLPVAIARLCRGIEGAEVAKAIEVFVAAIGTHTKTAPLVVQGVIQGLSLLGDDDDDEGDRAVRAALTGTAAHGDRGARNQALLALGRVAGRHGAGKPGSGPSDARALLLDRLSGGADAERPWSALALALLESANAEPSKQVVEALRFVLANRDGPQEAGAYCLALALLHDTPSIPVIEAHTQDGDENLRGYAAIALGLLRSQASAPILRQVVVEKTRYRPGLLREASIALALLGDKSIVPYLIDRLRASNTMIEAVATASALGFVGDVRAIDPLVALVKDPQASETTRAFAAVALGQICDKERLPWNAKLAADASWLGAPPTFFDPLLGKGVLDLL
jgi:HEAT repeat protein